MTDRPIIFSGAMVRALLDGRKTQTRRLATSPLRRCEPGDRLWVREAWSMADAFDEDSPKKAAKRVNRAFKPNVFFNADGAVRSAGAATGVKGKLRPSIHMPRWASRLTLKVTAVRTECLQAISEADAEAEGAVWDSADGFDVWYFPGARVPRNGATACDAYRELWNHLHPETPWDEHPDVLVLTFTVEQANVDRLAA